MAQTTAEFLIEQGKTEGKAEGKQDAVLKLCSSDFSTCQKRSLAKSAISTTTYSWIFS